MNADKELLEFDELADKLLVVIERILGNDASEILLSAVFRLDKIRSRLRYELLTR